MVGKKAMCMISGCRLLPADGQYPFPGTIQLFIPYLR